jgi:hydroxypyruvate isomerase
MDLHNFRCDSVKAKKKNPKQINHLGLYSGGDCEIRTHGPLRVGSFQDCWFKPLTQVSGAGVNSRYSSAMGENAVMTSLAANLSTLFTDVPFLERFALARSAGFEVVECQFPYEASPEVVRRAMADAGVRLVLLNLPAGQWAAGDRGLACHPQRVDEFRASVWQGLRYAQALGVQQVHAMAGIVPAGVGAELAWSTLVDNLRFAADALAAHGVRVLVEPINTFDIPGYALSVPDQAARLMDAVGRENVAMQFDFYHVCRMGLDVLAQWRLHAARIGHVQIADVPGRAEPGTGDMDFGAIWSQLADSGYAGHVGCEYFPQNQGPGGTQAGLAWLDAHGFRV